jgi:hypothetical protein
MREPSPKLMSTWNYGPEPKDYKTIVLASPVLASKDVDNPRFEFQGAPKKTWIPHGTADFLYGWGGSVKRFGSKTGTMTYQYIIRNGNLIHITSANDSRLFKL